MSRPTSNVLFPGRAANGGAGDSNIPALPFSQTSVRPGEGTSAREMLPCCCETSTGEPCAPLASIVSIWTPYGPEKRFHAARNPPPSAADTAHGYDAWAGPIVKPLPIRMPSGPMNAALIGGGVEMMPDSDQTSRKLSPLGTIDDTWAKNRFWPRTFGVASNSAPAAETRAT